MDTQILNLINEITIKKPQITELAKIEIREIPKVSNDPVSLFMGVGAILGGVGAGLGAAAAGITGWSLAGAIVAGVVAGLGGGQFLGGLIAGIPDNSVAPDFKLIQGRKSASTFSFNGSTDNLATLGSAIPLVYCNIKDNPWGGVRYQGKIVSMYIENQQNKGDAYIVSILSNGYLEEINLDNLYLGSQSIDELYKSEIELHLKIDENTNIASTSENPSKFRLSSQVVFPENYNTIGANYITETTNFTGQWRDHVEVMNGQWGGTIWYENAITKFNSGQIYTSEGNSGEYWQEFRIKDIKEDNNLIYVSRHLTGYLWDGVNPNDKSLKISGVNNPDYEEIQSNYDPQIDGRIFQINKAYYRTTKLINEVRFNFNVILHKNRLAQYEETVSG